MSECSKANAIGEKEGVNRELANTSAIFGELRQPKADYLVYPEVSSERRVYLPIDYMPSSVLPSIKLYTLADASLYHFGILSSALNMARTRAVTGRMKSDYQFSAGIVYNNFPWLIITSDAVARQSITNVAGMLRHDLPRNDKRISAIESAVQAVLEACAARGVFLSAIRRLPVCCRQQKKAEAIM